MKTCYISGQITGLPIEEARKNFQLVENELRSAGLKPVNPFRVSPYSPYKMWKDYMVEGIEALMRCDCIYMAKGWRQSKGALIEKKLAEDLEIDFYFISND